MGFEINVDKYSFAAEPEKAAQNYAAELAKKLVEEEKTERSAGDLNLKSQIDAETAQRKTKDNELLLSITELNSKITAEAANRVSQDQTLSDSLSSETAQRKKADSDLVFEMTEMASQLEGRINGEIEERVLQDSKLSKRIDGCLTEHQDISGKADKVQVQTELLKLEGSIASHSLYIGELTSDVRSMQSTVNGISEELPMIYNYVSEIIDRKADATLIMTYESPNYTFDFYKWHNCEMRLLISVVESISFNFGNGEYPSNYISGLSFDSGATPTSIDYTGSRILNWVGTDCATVDGLSIFQPSANTHYDIVFYFNGVQFIGLVNGFVPALGNEVTA